ncbi:MAG: M23 family metallopeptidase [Gammaproteobacteria bacterium]|nr:M23 family metallopeptidase [Gammaproteobacteria bacterium]
MIFRWCTVLVLSALVAACGGGGSGTSTPPPVGAFCDTKTFTPAAQSPYVLPYPAGVTYTMFQGNCSPPPGGHQTTFAYDFDHAMGDPITAARAGRVTSTANNFPDDGNPANAGGNSVWVLHSDGTVAAYFHMNQGSVMVTVGQDVVAGDILGLAGNSGASSGPHLHFQVFETNTSFNNEDAVPISFSNATGRTGSNGELLEGEAYTAN